MSLGMHSIALIVVLSFQIEVIAREERWSYFWAKEYVCTEKCRLHGKPFGRLLGVRCTCFCQMDDLAICETDSGSDGPSCEKVCRKKGYFGGDCFYGGICSCFCYPTDEYSSSPTATPTPGNVVAIAGTDNTAAGAGGQPTPDDNSTTAIAQEAVENSTLADSTLLDNSTLVEDALVENSTIVEDALLGNSTIVEDALLENSTIPEEEVEEDEPFEDTTILEDTLMENSTISEEEDEEEELFEETTISDDSSLENSTIIAEDEDPLEDPTIVDDAPMGNSTIVPEGVLLENSTITEEVLLENSTIVEEDALLETPAIVADTLWENSTIAEDPLLENSTITHNPLSENGTTTENSIENSTLTQDPTLENPMNILPESVGNNEIPNNLTSNNLTTEITSGCSTSTINNSTNCESPPVFEATTIPAVTPSLQITNFTDIDSLLPLNTVTSSNQTNARNSTNHTNIGSQINAISFDFNNDDMIEEDVDNDFVEFSLIFPPMENSHAQGEENVSFFGFVIGALLSGLAWLNRQIYSVRNLFG